MGKTITKTEEPKASGKIKKHRKGPRQKVEAMPALLDIKKEIRQSESERRREEFERDRAAQEERFAEQRRAVAAQKGRENGLNILADLKVKGSLRLFLLPDATEQDKRRWRMDVNDLMNAIKSQTEVRARWNNDWFQKGDFVVGIMKNVQKAS